MKAISFAETGGPEVLRLADVPVPDVRPGRVLIKSQAIGVNFADTRFRQGTYAVKPKLPDTPGLEAAGVIEAVGEGVTALRPGMRVAFHAAHGDPGLPRQDARERYPLLRPHARGPTQAAHREDLPADRGRGGASLSRVAPVDGKAHPGPVMTSRTRVT